MEAEPTGVIGMSEAVTKKLEEKSKTWVIACFYQFLYIVQFVQGP